MIVIHAILAASAIRCAEGTLAECPNQQESVDGTMVGAETVEMTQRKGRFFV